MLFGCVFLSCEGILEPDKDNQYTLDRVFNDPAFAEGILLKAYALLPSEYGLEDVATDNAVSNDKANSYLRMATGEWSALYNPADVWSSSYDAIFNTNYFLSVVDSVNWSWKSSNRKKLFAQRFKGEALALRAYYHMQLLIKHGGISADGALLGIPLVTNVIDVEDEWRLPRDSYQTCVDQIIQDYDSAFKILPYEWKQYPALEVDSQIVFGEQNLNRIHGKAIKALKSKFLLHAGSPAFNQGVYDAGLCEKAAKEAGELIAKIGGTAGIDPGGQKFYDGDDDPTKPEILWRNNYVDSRNREAQNFPPSLYGKGMINPTQNLVDAFPMANGYPIDNVLSGYDAADPYKNRDSRLKSYIVYDGNKIGSKTIETDLDSPQDGLNKITTSTRTGYYMSKLLRSDVQVNPANANVKRHFYTHVRYTEVFLIYAEAANEAWGPDSDPLGYGFTARDVVTAIRTRAGIAAGDPYLASLTTKEEMRTIIRNERRLELCFEGFRFWDLRRWKCELNETAKGVEISGTVFTPIEVETRNYKDYMYYGPIPNDQIIKYQELTQNQGW